MSLKGYAREFLELALIMTICVVGGLGLLIALLRVLPHR